jgi:hypothetical protein
MKRVRVRVRVIKSVHQLDEEFEDTKRGIIIISISKKNRQHNGQKIPKRKSESVYRRRTNNTLAKRKSTKGQTTIYKTYIEG